MGCWLDRFSLGRLVTHVVYDLFGYIDLFGHLVMPYVSSSVYFPHALILPHTRCSPSPAWCQTCLRGHLLLVYGQLDVTDNDVPSH